MRRLLLFATLLMAALAAGCGGGGGGGSEARASAAGTTTPLQGGRLSIVLDQSARQDRMEVQGDEVLLAVSGTPSRVLIRLLDDTGSSIVGDTEISLDPANPTERRSVTITGIPFGTWKLAITTFDSNGEIYSYFETFVTVGAGGSTSVRALAVVALQIAAVGGTTIPVGVVGEVGATGVLSNGTTVDLSDDVVWSVSDPSRASLQRGSLTGVAVGPVEVTARYGPLQAVQSFTISNAVLTRLQVDPGTASIAAGFSQVFTATGTFSDGSTRPMTDAVAWTSSDDGVATPAAEPGTVAGLSPGTATVSARHAASGIEGTATLQVTPAVLQSLQVDPPAPSVPLGVRQQFTATGAFSDGSTRDLTAQVQWSSTDPAVATVSNLAGSEGLATSLATGQTTVRALHVASNVQGETTLDVTAAAITSLGVTPAFPQVPMGRAQQFTATGTFTDGSVVDVTGIAVWGTSDAGVITISNGFATKTPRGEAAPVAPGVATITATVGVVTGSTGVQVTTAILDRVEVTPLTASLPAGRSTPFAATGVFTDGTTQDLTNTVTWESTDVAVATLSNAPRSQGVATGVTPGVVDVRALDVGTGLVGTAQLTVTSAVLASLEVTPAFATLPKGRTQQYTATGVFSDGARLDLTGAVAWTTPDNGVAGITAGGLVTAAQEGDTTVDARDPGTGITGSTDLTVSAAALDSLELEPVGFKLIAGATVPFKAKGHYSDGSAADITASVTWASSAVALATVDNVEVPGLVTGVAKGTVTISATDAGTGVVATTLLEIVEITSLRVEPSAVQVFLLGGPVSVKAVADLSDGTTNQDVTDICNWRLQSGAAGTVGDVFGVDKGVLTAFGDGLDVVFAREPGGQGLEGSATVEFFGPGA